MSRNELLLSVFFLAVATGSWGCAQETTSHDSPKLGISSAARANSAEVPKPDSSFPKPQLQPFPDNDGGTCDNGKISYDEEKALEKFMKTEEVGRFRKAIGRTGRRINTIPSQTPCCPDDCWWGFQVGSVNGAMFVTEFNVRIQATNGAMQIYDHMSRQYVDYETWQSKRKSPQN